MSKRESAKYKLDRRMGENIGGRPLLLLGALLVLMGTQLIAIGLLGEILIRIYHEPEGREQYRLREPPGP